MPTFEEQSSDLRMAQAAKVALLAEFDGEDLTGYFLIGDFGIFHAGFHVFDGCAGFDLVIGIVGGGEDNLVVVVGVECDFFPRLFHGEREDSGVGAADVAQNAFDRVLRALGIASGIVGRLLGDSDYFTVDSFEDDGFSGGGRRRFDRARGVPCCTGGHLCSSAILRCLKLFEAVDAALHHLVFCLRFRNARCRFENADRADVLLLLTEDACGVETIVEVLGLDLNGLDVQHMGLIELFIVHRIEVRKGVVGGGERWIEFDGGVETGFDCCVLTACSSLHRQRREVVMGEVAVRVELHRFAVPLSSSGNVMFAELEITHRLVCEGVVWILLETGGEKGFSLFGALVVDENIGADCVSFGCGDRAPLKRRHIDCERRVHLEHAEHGLLHIVFEGSLELIEVAESMLRRSEGIFSLDEELSVVVDPVSVFLAIVDDQIMGESPGFSVEDRTFLFIVIVGRRVINLEDSRDGNQAILAEIDDVIGTRLTQKNLFVANVGVLIELSVSLVKPERKPCGLHQHEVGVLVVDGGEWVLFSFSVEPEEDVVFIRRTQKKTSKVELVFGEVGFGFERLKSFFVFQGQDDDGRARVGGCGGHERVKDGAHLLELTGYAARLLFVGVGEDQEVWALHFEPVFVRFACQGRKSDTKEEQGRKWLAHNSQRVNHADSEGKVNFPCICVDPEGSAAVAARIKVGEPESGKCFPFSRGSGSAIAAFLAPTQARISLKIKGN
jgi:hypothetical protein